MISPTSTLREEHRVILRALALLEVAAARLGAGPPLRDGLWDPQKMRIDMTKYRPLARLFGNFYASLGEPFTHVRQSYEEWLADQKK